MDLAPPVGHTGHTSLPPPKKKKKHATQGWDSGQAAAEAEPLAWQTDWCLGLKQVVWCLEQTRRMNENEKWMKWHVGLDKSDE